MGCVGGSKPPPYGGYIGKEKQPPMVSHGRSSFANVLKLQVLGQKCLRLIFFVAEVRRMIIIHRKNRHWNLRFPVRRNLENPSFIFLPNCTIQLFPLCDEIPKSPSGSLSALTKQALIGILIVSISLIISSYGQGEIMQKEGLLSVGFWDKLFSKTADLLYAPVSGRTISLNQVPDTAIANGLLGKGIAIIPAEGRILAPCDATVDMIFETGHAVSLIADFGAEILIHVGLETVSLKGRYFTVRCKNGCRVMRGDVLIEFDLQALAAEGCNTITPLLVHNSSSYATFKTVTEKHVTSADVVIELRK